MLLNFLISELNFLHVVTTTLKFMQDLLKCLLSNFSFC